MKALSLIALGFITSCANLPDPLTCDRALEECQKAIRLADARAEKERKEGRCPRGAVCIEGQRNIQIFQNSMRFPR